MRDTLEDAYQHGRIERDTYMHLLDLIDEAEQDYDALEERMRAEVERLEQENARLRDQLDAKEHDAKRNLREYMRVCDGLRELCRDMFGEHQRIYRAALFTRTGASSTQMAHWYDELRELVIEVGP